MAKQTFTTGQVLTAAQMTSLQQTAMGGGSATAKTASYTLVAADAGATVIMNSASATTITVNTSLFSAGDTVFIQNIGAGVSTITAGTATVNTASSLALAQYESGSLYFTAAGASIFSKADGAAAGGGGKVLQVVEGSYSTQVNNSTTTFQDTNVTANITPSSASSKILIIVKQHGYKDAGDIESGLIVRLMRDATSIDDVSGFYTATSLILYGELTLMKLDAPNTTSQITYKTQFRNNAAAAKVSVNVGYPSRITLMEIGA